MSHFPKVPVRHIAGNQELLKSMTRDVGPTTEYTNPEDVPKAQMTPSYRTPIDRANGNVIFRRYPNGLLDVGYARDKVLEGLRCAKEGIPLNGAQEAALSVLFPGIFAFVAPALHNQVMRVSLRITPAEGMAVAQAVAQLLEEQHEYKLFKRQ